MMHEKQATRGFLSALQCKMVACQLITADMHFITSLPNCMRATLATAYDIEGQALCDMSVS